LNQKPAKTFFISKSKASKEFMPAYQKLKRAKQLKNNNLLSDFPKF
jgi:hypothetical protein